MARPPTQQAIFNRVKKSMTEMGTYSKHYDDIIKIYAGLIFDYNAAREEFIENGSKVVDEYETNRGTIVERKTPIVQTMENLRKDIITYSDRLRLNPKAADVEVGKPSKEVGGLEGLIANLI